MKAHPSRSDEHGHDEPEPHTLPRTEDTQAPEETPVKEEDASITPEEQANEKDDEPDRQTGQEPPAGVVAC